MVDGISSTEVYSCDIPRFLWYVCDFDRFLSVLLFNDLVFSTLTDDLSYHIILGCEPILQSWHLFYFHHFKMSKVVCSQGDVSLYLTLKACGDNIRIHLGDNTMYSIQLIVHTSGWWNIWVFSVLFPVFFEYPDGQFLMLGIFASFFLDVIYGNSMFGRHNAHDYSLLEISLVTGVLNGSRVDLLHPFRAR